MRANERRTVVRKFVCILLIVIIAMLPMFSISATEEDSNETSIDPELGRILVDAFDTSERESLQDKNIYHETVSDLVIADQPIVKIYDEFYWNKSHLPLEDLLDASKNEDSDYIIFDKSPMRIRKAFTGGIYNCVLLTMSRESDDVNFINDIQNMEANTDILGQSCKISNIVVFDGYTSFSGAALYVISDKGVFVKYYKDQKDEGSWFKEDDYRNWAKEYYEYLTSDEVNIGKNGEPMGGRTNSFLDIVKAHNEEADNSSNSQCAPIAKIPTYIWIISISGAIVLCASVVIFIFRKRIFISKYRR